MSIPDEKMARVLESQGYRELVTAHLFSSGVALAPTLDDKHMLADHAREELGHFEVVSTLYDRLFGKSLYEIVSERARRVALPASWLESAVAGYIVDRAAAIQLTDYKRLPDERLGRLVDEILEHEHEHQSAAETALLDQCKSDPKASELAAAFVARWFQAALDVLDGDDPESRGRVVAQLVESLRPTLSACRLTLPRA